MPTTLGGLLIWAIVILGVAAIFSLAVKTITGRDIPPWLERGFWIIVAVVGGCFAIRFLLAQL